VRPKRSDTDVMLSALTVLQQDGTNGAPMANDDKVTKAEFVWLMVQLAELDREKFREIRSKGWDSVQSAPAEKSVRPN
jgi:hypothetical protein